MHTIIPISAFSDNYIWLIHNNKRQCLVVDPGAAQPVIDYLSAEQLELVAILVTHHHFDHCGGVPELLKHYNVPVYASAKETVKGATRTVQEGDMVNIPALQLTFKVLDIPAHTAGHIAYYDDAWVFSGDTLFSAGCGRLFEGSAEQMLQSLHKLANLAATTQVYCGHEYTQRNLEFALTVDPNHEPSQKRYQEVVTLRQQSQPSLPSTIAIEKATNPFLRCQDPNIKAAVESHFKQDFNNEIGVFTALRKWKDNF
ncbi:MAG: hydroxyacylglutathione hydrolase [Pseudomonadota bacterium]